MKLLSLFVLLITICYNVIKINAFVLPQSKGGGTCIKKSIQLQKQLINEKQINKQKSTTELYFLLTDHGVHQFFWDNQFTISWPVLYILDNWVQRQKRHKLEEEAWNERLKDARNHVLELNPTLTERELLKLEAQNSYSYYGKDTKKSTSGNDFTIPFFNNDKGKTQTIPIDDGDGDGSDGHYIQYQRPDRNELNEKKKNYKYGNRQYHLSDDEIYELETVHGIEYDPYYDDPYTIDELPDAPKNLLRQPKFYHSNFHGLRYYHETGETFYKNKNNGLWYRSGSKPKGYQQERDMDRTMGLFGTNDYNSIKNA